MEQSQIQLLAQNPFSFSTLKQSGVRNGRRTYFYIYTTHPDLNPGGDWGEYETVEEASYSVERLNQLAALLANHIQPPAQPEQDDQS